MIEAKLVLQHSLGVIMCTFVLTIDCMCFNRAACVVYLSASRRQRTSSQLSQYYLSRWNNLRLDGQSERPSIDTPLIICITSASVSWWINWRSYQWSQGYPVCIQRRLSLVRPQWIFMFHFKTIFNSLIRQQSSACQQQIRRRYRVLNK